MVAQEKYKIIFDYYLFFYAIISIQTSITERFSKDSFNRDYNQTLGIDYYLKRINLTRKLNENN